MPKKKTTDFKKRPFCRFKISSLLLGFLVGFFYSFSTLGVKHLLITIWGEDAVTKSTTDAFVVSLLCSFFFLASEFVILGFLYNLVAISYSASRGHQKDLTEEMVCTWNIFLLWVLLLASV
jgi:hypothetical protein